MIDKKSAHLEGLVLLVPELQEGGRAGERGGPGRR